MAAGTIERPHSLRDLVQGSRVADVCDQKPEGQGADQRLDDGARRDRGICGDGSCAVRKSMGAE
jgi:hypothetical protein